MKETQAKLVKETQAYIYSTLSRQKLMAHSRLSLYEWHIDSPQLLFTLNMFIIEVAFKP